MASPHVVVEPSLSPGQRATRAADDLAQVKRQLVETEQDVRLTAALLELVTKLVASPNLSHGYITLVNELTVMLECRHVAIGIRRNEKSPCRLQAISGFGDFDRRSEMAQAIQSALDEAVLNGQETVWLREGNQARQANIALKQAGTMINADMALSIPLCDDAGTAIGALFICGDGQTEQIALHTKTLRAAQQPLSRGLQTLRRVEANFATRIIRATCARLRTWKGLLVLLALAGLCGSMAIPLPYNVHCECRLEPVQRRYIVAPFEGTLEKALVKPGDLVTAGDVLARMDAREIRFERAGLVADRHQAAKKRDAALAAQEYGEAQIARLEMERLDVQIQLLDHRADNLEIKSPIDGIVTSGDWERAEGKPLEIGESMFEVAPLDEMVVELAIPQNDIAYVAEDQPVHVRLDSFAGQSFDVELKNVHPRSEIRDNKNVFIAEATLENTKATLQPGMNGRAKITTPDQSLGWILFHKPWETVQRWLGI